MFDNPKKLAWPSWSCAALVAGLGLAFAITALGVPGDQGGEQYGDNPNHQKGLMTGKIKKDCTNFSFASNGVLTADCNTSEDEDADPESTSINLTDHLRFSYTEARRIIMSNDTVGWNTNDNWNETAGWFVNSACSDRETYYEDGWVRIRGECQNPRTGNKEHFWTDLSITHALGGLSTNNSGQLVFK